jgi:hypothetical protein
MEELLEGNFAGPTLCDALVICTWNVRGLTDLKLYELILHMTTYDIDVLCIQETHISSSAVRYERGYTVILSGSDEDSRSWAGVGIIVAPRCRHRIKSYKQISDRLCSLKLKVDGGILGLISAYAPHNLHVLSARFGFFSELDHNYRRLSANVAKLVIGDLNSRVGASFPGEEHIIGPHSFGRRAVHQVEVPNRDLLLEFREGNTVLVANSFLPGPPEHKATLIEPGSTYLGTVSETGYNMLDLFLCDEVTLHKCTQLAVIREAALGTDHYLVKASFSFDLARDAGKSRRRWNVQALSDASCRTAFANAFCEAVGTHSEDGTISNWWSAGRTGMEEAAKILPDNKYESVNKPWISQATLELINQRRHARAQNELECERRLHKEVRKSAKQDRTAWLDQMLQDGSWLQVRKLRKPRRANCCKLRGRDGQLVESDRWADTMADHLEEVQWHVRTAGLVDGPPLGAELPVVLGKFTEQEVSIELQKLKKKRATGPDEIPAEFWQTVGETEEGLAWITELCNRCWTEERLPEDWHRADVMAIHKKGSVETCDNYRPISLICVAYKLFASLLLRRLQCAGAERRLTSTQFGFRCGRGTTDAIFAVRRSIDLALAHKHGRTVMLALDWAKAFDSINVEAMLKALSRFGLPPKILRILKHIYEGRFFSVLDGDSRSTERSQRSGISQGCPLSPSLFVMLMSVMMKDAVSSLPQASQELFGKNSLDAYLYADDTLLVGASQERVQELLDAVARVGADYGMALHWSKFQLLEVSGSYHLMAPDGTAIVPSELMTYLGAAIYADGRIKSELNRRLGAAWAEFCKMSRLWKHTTLSRERKIEIFNACILTRLLYSLSSAWLNVAETRRLNGFHCRCLRVILNIKVAFISRVSNASVLQTSSQLQLSKQLLKQQLILYGKVARSPDADPLRMLTFVPGTLLPLTGQYVRRVGRPRNEWVSMLHKEYCKMGAGRSIFIELDWREAVYQYIHSV